MPSRAHRLLLCLTFVTVARFATAAPQASASATPHLTPGKVALLVASSDPTVSSQLEQALRSDDPSVRRVAGRVIAATSRRELVDPLKKALALEQDPRVAAELVSDLLDAAGAAAVPVAEAAVQRVGGATVLSFAEWLARMQPEQLAAKLPELTNHAGKNARDLANPVALAVAEHPALRDRLFRSWMAVAPEHAWNEFLDAACSTADALSGADALLTEALRSSRPSVRAETVWFVVDTLAQKRQLSSAVIDAALPSDAQAADLNGEALGRELVARHEKKAAIVDRSTQIGEFLRKHHGVTDLDAFPELTRQERERAKHRLGDEWQSRFYQPAGHTRIVPSLAPGLFSSLVRETGCQTETGHDRGFFESTFGENGLPRSAAEDYSILPPACRSIVDTLARLTSADADDSIHAASQSWVVVPLDSAFVACASEPEPPAPSSDDNWSETSSRGALESTSKIQPPEELRKPPPAYPVDAVRRRVQGTVGIQATLSSTGCVRSARVVRSVDPALDLAALRAVAEWSYSPARKDGVAVPVLLTVTVNFSLR
ncbi:MAG TPA: energy transducer TonB [Vicinamibacterales bacterium]|nr:energy transducer TonB [Vicinamibacterales bacterium]